MNPVKPVPTAENPLVVIAGPTAAGKTELSIALAKKIGGEIISADSMQIYKGFDIGTAKIRSEDMQGIRHYLIDELDPSEEFHVFEFKKRAEEAIRIIRKNGRIPILVGGTGFYIQAVLYDIHFAKEGTDKNYRRLLEEKAEKEGAQTLHQLLSEVDPKAAGRIHANNIKRTIRALEFFHETGSCISEHNEEQRRRQSPYQYAYFVLNRERKLLYERIHARVDRMISDGLVQEVKRLLDSGISANSLAMQGLGYKEIASYLRGEGDLETAVRRIKAGTRHFAKRQLTWFRREQDVIWLPYEDYGNDKESLLNAMLHALQEKHII